MNPNTRPIKHLRLWCTRCGTKTPHTYRPALDMPTRTASYPETPLIAGLPWKCDHCALVTPRTAYQLSTAERL